MMFSFTSPTRTAVFLARIVIPFSRSRSIESRTRSFTSWFSRNEPACQSSASTSVVLPWSTWATIATLRRSSRRAVRFGLDTGGHGSANRRGAAAAAVAVGGDDHEVEAGRVAELRLVDGRGEGL